MAAKPVAPLNAICFLRFWPGWPYYHGLWMTAVVTAATGCSAAIPATSDHRPAMPVAKTLPSASSNLGTPAARAAMRRHLAELLQNHDVNRALPLAETLYRSSVGEEEKLSYGFGLADLQLQLRRNLAAMATLADLYSQLRSAKLQQHTRDKAAQYLSGFDLESSQTLQRLTQSQPNYLFLFGPATLHTAKLLCDAHQDDQCAAMLDQLLQRRSSSNEQQQARMSLQLLRNRLQVNPNTLGVILPLSGKYAAFGERALTAIKLAIPTHIGLIVKDSQGNPELASQQVEALAMQHHVLAIIGPLFSGESLAAAEKAQALGMVLMSLSHRINLSQVGPYVFRSGLTIKAQAKALAEVSFNRLGLRSFAFLYPNNPYGLEFIQAFWDEVELRHGKVMGVEAYESDSTTFRIPVRKLVGKFILETRPDYHELQKTILSKKIPAWRKNQMLHSLEKKLEPIVDFDAIVIPDSARQIGLIAPALAFEDITLTHNPKLLEKMSKANKRKITPITLLGGSTWNSPLTTESCEQYCDAAVFVDAFFASSPNDLVQSFVDRFRSATLGSLPSLSEAIAFDSAAVLVELMVQRAPQTRVALMQALLTMPEFVGVTGNFRFDADGDIVRQLQAFTIKSQHIEVLPTNPNTTIPLNPF